MDNLKEPEVIPLLIDNSSNRPKLTDKQIGYKALRESGYKPQEASKMVGYTPTYGYHLDARLQKLQIGGNKKLLKSAHNALKSILKGETFGELKEIKDSTVMSAVKEVYERHEPVIKQNLNVNLNADISPVDLGKYRNGP